MFRDLRQQPNIRSVVWFDVAKQTDWQINRLTQAAAAFATGLRALAPLTDAPGPAAIDPRYDHRSGAARGRVRQKLRDVQHIWRSTHAI
jgi:hypothetical protein